MRYFKVKKMTKLIKAGLIVTLMTIGAYCQTIKVLQTTNNAEKYQDGSGAHLGNEQEFELVDFSVCFRFFFFGKRDDYNTLIYSKHDQDLVDLILGRVIFGVTESILSNDKPILVIGLLNVWNQTFISWPAKEWHHVCLSYENNSSAMTVVSNGGKHLEKVSFEPLRKNPTQIPPEFLNLSLIHI